jgi:hypothetical protein
MMNDEKKAKNIRENSCTSWAVFVLNFGFSFLTFSSFIIPFYPLDKTKKTLYIRNVLRKNGFFLGIHSEETKLFWRRPCDGLQIIVIPAWKYFTLNDRE